MSLNDSMDLKRADELKNQHEQTVSCLSGSCDRQGAPFLPSKDEKVKDRLQGIMILTPEQLADLTDKKRPKDQIAWLTEHGYRFEISALGRPKVLLKEVEGKMLSPECKTKIKISTVPDFATINTN